MWNWNLCRILHAESCPGLELQLYEQVLPASQEIIKNIRNYSLADYPRQLSQFSCLSYFCISTESRYNIHLPKFHLGSKEIFQGYFVIA